MRVNKKKAIEKILKDFKKKTFLIELEARDDYFKHGAHVDFLDEHYQKIDKELKNALFRALEVYNEPLAVIFSYIEKVTAGRICRLMDEKGTNDENEK